MARTRESFYIEICYNSQTNSPQISSFTLSRENDSGEWKIKKRKLWISAIEEHIQVQSRQPSQRATTPEAHSSNYISVEDSNNSLYVPSISPSIQLRIYQKSSEEIHQEDDYLHSNNSNSSDSSNVQMDKIRIRTDIFDRNLSIKMDSVDLKLHDAENQTDFVDTTKDFDLKENALFCSKEPCGSMYNTQIQVNIPVQNLDNQTSPQNSCQGCEIQLPLGPHDITNRSFYRSAFGIQFITTDSELMELTGTSFVTFHFLLKTVPNTQDLELIPPNKLLLTLMKLKMGMDFQALENIFKIDATVSYRIFIGMIQNIYDRLNHFISWPTKKMIKVSLPNILKKYHPNARVIKHYIEMIFQQPADIEHLNIPQPVYRSLTTAKFFVGFAPCGLICFLSKCHNGTVTNSSITTLSGLYGLLKRKDETLCIGETIRYHTDVLDYIAKLHKRLDEFYIFTRMTRDLLPYMDYIPFVISILINIPIVYKNENPLAS